MERNSSRSRAVAEHRTAPSVWAKSKARRKATHLGGRHQVESDARTVTNLPAKSTNARPCTSAWGKLKPWAGPVEVDGLRGVVTTGNSKVREVELLGELQGTAMVVDNDWEVPSSSQMVSLRCRERSSLTLWPCRAHGRGEASPRENPLEEIAVVPSNGITSRTSTHHLGVAAATEPSQIIADVKNNVEAK